MDRLHLDLLKYADRGDIDNLVVLLRDHQGIDVHQGNQFGLTALHFAVQSQSLPCVELLLQNGANVNEQSIDGITPLMVAAQTGSELLVEYLLNNGARPDAKVSLTQSRSGDHNSDARSLTTDPDVIASLLKRDPDAK